MQGRRAIPDVERIPRCNVMTGAGGARRLIVWVSCAALANIVLAIAACSLQKAAPDPAVLEQQIADARVEELELVRSTIHDSGRADRFIELLGARDRLIDAFVDDVTQHREAMARLNADYDAERSDFETLLADYNRKRTAGQAALIDLIADMKESTTADEWDVIADFQMDRLDIRRLAYRDSGGARAQ